MNSLSIGFGQSDITPKGTFALVGQFSTRITNEVRTPLQAVAAVISAPGQKAVYWAACDLLYITESLIDAVCQRLSQQWEDFHRSQLILSATHIHTGPFLQQRIGGTLLSFHANSTDILTPAECCAQVADGVAAAIMNAVADQESVLTARTSAAIPTSYCRRVVYKDGTAKMYGKLTENFSHMECRDGGDTRLIYVYRACDKTLKGVIADVPCTAQVDEGVSIIHSDYWHFTREYVKTRLNVPVFGLCACAGDLSPRNLPNPSELSREEQTRQLGEFIGKSICNNICTEFDSPAFSHKFAEPELERWNPTPAEYLSAKVIVKHMQEIYNFAPGTFPKADKRFPSKAYTNAEIAVLRFNEKVPALKTPIHALRLGNALFITNPFECFVHYADAIQAALPELDIFDVQLTDNYYGYLPTREAVYGGGYSAMMFNGECTPAAGDQMVEESCALLKQLLS